MVRRMSAKEARDRFAELLGQVYYGKDTIIVQKQGKPMVAVIDVDRYEQMAKAWDEPYRILDRIWVKSRGRALDKVQEDVAAAIAEIRSEARTRSRRRA